TAALSSASPALFAALTGGLSYATATLTQKNAAGQPVAVWVLGNVTVTDDALTRTGSGLPAEELKLAFGPITEVTKTSQASWTLLTNTATGPAWPNPSTLAPLNSPPTIAGTQAALTVNEGSLATNSGTFDDPDGRATDTLTTSVGTVIQNTAAGTWSWS